MKPNYGIDAPLVVRNLIVAGVVVACATLAFSFRQNTIQVGFALALSSLSALPFVLSAGLMVWSSKIGKQFEVERVLDTLEIGGDEFVLDIGCGRGLMLIAAAKRLQTGLAVGLDVWRSEDQSGNSPEATLNNARAEGVFDEIRVVTGDASQLPFKNQSFDLVTAILSLHNIVEKEERDSAVREIARVMKVNGRVVIVDFKYTREYYRILRESGIEDVVRSPLHFLIYPPVRFVKVQRTTSRA